MLFKNKHIITALVVTPILSIISYFAVDYLVKEKPQPAVQGHSYKLVARANCRYSSGQCDLVNADFVSKLVVNHTTHRKRLQLSTNLALDGVRLQIKNNTAQPQGTSSLMQTVNNNRQNWVIDLPEYANQDSTIYIAMSANGSNYYAETSMAFSQYQTLFDKDFRKPENTKNKQDSESYQ